MTTTTDEEVFADDETRFLSCWIDTSPEQNLAVLRARAQSAKFIDRSDVLLFWALDRLTREGTLATLQYLERLTSYQVGYKSFTEPYLDSCGTFKDVVISLLATMAKQERIRMSERVNAGLALARRQGKRLGRLRCAASMGMRSRKSVNCVAVELVFAGSQSSS
jgi:DNA invertase Pin-like site-specific DNA recombinase